MPSPDYNHHPTLAITVEKSVIFSKVIGPNNRQIVKNRRSAKASERKQRNTNLRCKLLKFMSARVETCVIECALGDVRWSRLGYRCNYFLIEVYTLTNRTHSDT